MITRFPSSHPALTAGDRRRHAGWLRLLAMSLAGAGLLGTARSAEPTVRPVAYERIPYTLPAEPKFEVSGIAVLPDGRAALTLRKGEVWILENPLEDPTKARFSRFASGLHEPLGLTLHQGALYTTQRSEVTRLEDRDGDGVAEPCRDA